MLVDKIHHFQIGYIISCDVFISFLLEVQFILYQKPITSIVFIYQLIHFHNVSLKCYKHIVALHVNQIFLFYLFEILIRNHFDHLFESSIFIIMEIIYYLVHEIHENFVYDFNDNYSPIIFVDFSCLNKLKSDYKIFFEIPHLSTKNFISISISIDIYCNKSSNLSDFPILIVNSYFNFGTYILISIS